MWPTMAGNAAAEIHEGKFNRQEVLYLDIDYFSSTYNFKMVFIACRHFLICTPRSAFYGLNFYHILVIMEILNVFWFYTIFKPT